MAGTVYLNLESPESARKRWFDRIFAECAPLASETVPLAQSAGRFAARPLAARRSSPAFHGAAMDGIAVNAQATFAASVRNPLRLKIGVDAFPINTGQPLPKGANAVIMAEHMHLDDGFAIVEKAAFPWQHVRKTGEDMVATEIVLAPGTRIGPYELGAMAAAGILEPEVFKKPVVAIIPTGSDIVPVAQASGPDVESGHNLPEFNSLIFSAMLEASGAKPLILPIVPDDPEALSLAVTGALAKGCDLVILNAGTSAGSHDFSAEVIAGLGEVLSHGVAMMPGKPTILGLCRAHGRCAPIIGAPGYPVSATLALEEFVLPLLALWQKSAPAQGEELEAYPVNPLPSRPGMEERVRVKLGTVNGKTYAVPLPRGAGTVSSLSRADAIIAIPPDVEGLNAGEPVRASLLRPRAQIDSALLAIGSHDNTLDLIDSLLRRDFPGCSLTSAHTGSLGGLLALAQGKCHLAGSHLLDAETGIYNQAAIARHLRGIPVTLVRLADRTQGLIVKKGNPANIRSFQDLTRAGARFINRQRGSGTRVLLDYELARLGIPASAIAGYEDEEYTHMNVAAAVLSDRADAGLGVLAAANALGLDFIPVGNENYDLVIPSRYLDDERVQNLLRVIRSSAFLEATARMGGYNLDKTGEIIWQYA